MSTKTTNFEFLKPELTDNADITQYNSNWDKVDTKFKSIEDSLGNVATDVTPEGIGAAKDDLSNVDAEIVAQKVKDSGVELDGGLKYEKLTQAEYDALKEKDPDTLYIITDDTTAEDVKTHLADKTVHVTAEDRAKWNNAADNAMTYSYGTTDLEAGVTPLEQGKLHFVYE